MGLDLKDSVHLLRCLSKRDKELKARNVLGAYDSILLDKATSYIEDGLKHPENDMNNIHGEQPYLGWVLIMAFRYAINRHLTQALKDIEGVIVDNFHLMCDDFIGQMIRDINEQYRIYNIATEKRRDGLNGNPVYLEPFRQKCLNELERRGCPYRSFVFDEYDKVPQG